jgi:sarcosine oxidase subunit alpha
VCFGLYKDPDLRRALTAAIHRKLPDGSQELVQVAARRVTVAPGAYDAWPLFANNDLPGVMSLRGARRLWGEHGLVPGRHVAVHGKVPRIVETAWQNAGTTIVAQGTVEQAHGATHVEAATVDGQHVECDAIITTGAGLPRNELFQQAGCRFGFRAGIMAPLCDGHGATTHPQVYAAFSEEAKPW